MLIFQPGFRLTECSREPQNDSREFDDLVGGKKDAKRGKLPVNTYFNFFNIYIRKSDKITQPVIFHTRAETVPELPYIEQE